MPYTVPVSFDKFLESISLTGDHREVAEARRARLVSLLEKTFDILESFPTGSIPRYTAIKGHADLDVIVALHYSKHIKDKTPAVILQSVRDALGEYRTNVRKNGQAVTLHYESWPNVDIVPVSRSVNGDGAVTHYNVPDMNKGRWIESRPKTHSRNIDAKAKECGPHLRGVIRMIKCWNKAHSDLMESFHIEVLALRSLSGALTDYPWEVFQYFDTAAKLATVPLSYEGGTVDSYLDSETRKEVVKRLETARDVARGAWYLTHDKNNDHKEAIRLWRQIFGEKFPAYG